MSTIQTTIQLNNRVTQPLQQINNALQSTVTSFQNVNTSANTAMRDVRQNTEKTTESTGKLVNGIKGLVASYLTIRGAVNTVKEMVSAIETQQEAETKLETVMKQRMGSTTASINSIKQFTAAQQESGVIGDEVQMAGAQQLATFLNSEGALKSLIPAMNNLAVQQNGVSASSSDLVGIGNLMGKVMQGQTSALTRVGVTFTDAQEKVLKYGDEQERVAMLAQVITDNVGNMNSVMADTPQGAIQQVKNTFGDMMEVAGQQLLPYIQTLFQQIQENAPQIQTVLSGFATGVGNLLNFLMPIFGVVGDIAMYIQTNWSTIEPIIAGIAGALLLYNGYLAVSGFLHGIVAAATAIAATTYGVEAAAVTGAMIAQTIFNTVLNACPIILIVTLIALLIMAIVKWVKHVGGIKIAWMICMNAIKTAWDWVQIGLVTGIFFVIAKFLIFKLKIKQVVTNIQNFFGDLKVGVLGILQDMINGAIGIINDLINTVNKIPGVEIDAVQKVTFATDAGIQNEANKQARNAEVANYENEVNSTIADNDATLNQMKADAKKATAKRNAEITKAQKAAAKKADNAKTATTGNTAATNSKAITPTAAKTASNTGKTASNTSAIKDALDITSEDIKYIRDFAAQKAINRYTSTTVKVDMTNHNSISGDKDIDGMVNQLKNRIEEEMNASAEGVH